MVQFLPGSLLKVNGVSELFICLWSSFNVSKSLSLSLDCRYQFITVKKCLKLANTVKLQRQLVRFFCLDFTVRSVTMVINDAHSFHFARLCTVNRSILGIFWDLRKCSAALVVKFYANSWNLRKSSILWRTSWQSDNLRLIFVKVTVTHFSLRRSIGNLSLTNSEKI